VIPHQSEKPAAYVAAGSQTTNPLFLVLCPYLRPPGFLSGCDDAYPA